jgi:hypothetical protein
MTYPALSLKEVVLMRGTLVLLSTRRSVVVILGAILVALVLLASMAGLKPADAAPQGVTIDPRNFVREVTNPYFPLVPGTTFHYEGVTETDAGVVVRTRNEVIVTNQTKRILGVRTTVVHDLAYEEDPTTGEFVLVEETFDWFAQDRQGTVWYFGEDSRELAPDGTVISTEGSWQAGVDGAQPGIIMEADPQVGDRYHQEFARGVAEDQARVLSLDASLAEPVCLTDGRCFQDNLLLTEEWTRLEPGVVENKYYAAGVGFIFGEMVKGGEERTQLVAITT